MGQVLMLGGSIDLVMDPNNKLLYGSGQNFLFSVKYDYRDYIGLCF